MKGKQVVKNTGMLYLMNLTKLALPLITLPYLTRVLTVNSYGIVTFVKATMTYFQLFIDFGFILSATKDVVQAKGNKSKISGIVSDVMWGKLILTVVSLFSLFAMIIVVPILRENIEFVLLSFIPIGLSTFLFDFLFRGIEKMEVITYRFILMKGISTVLTFFCVKNNSDLLWIPILDILGTLIAIIWIFSSMRRMEIHIQKSKYYNIKMRLSESGTYFISTVATTAFGVLITFLVGILMKRSDIALWSIVLQLVNAVQALYTPIDDGIYPQMVKSKSFQLIKNVLMIFMPIVILGCLIVYFGSDLILLLVGGPQYTSAAPLLRAMIPVLFLSFPSMLFGWPVLGAIGRVKETTYTTVTATFVQIILLIVLIIFNQFTLVNLAISRGFTELVLLVTRLHFFRIYKSSFK